MDHLEPRNKSRRGFYLMLVVVLVIAFGMGILLSPDQSERFTETESVTNSY
jgi:hypothetical protein